MIESLTDKVTSFLSSDKELDNKEYEKLKYKTNSFIYLIVSVVSVVLIGLIFNKVNEGIILLICYLSIRKSAFGYKSSIYILRLMIFIGIFILTIFLSDFDDLTTYKSLVITFSMISFGGIYVLCPVNDIKNPIAYKKATECKVISRLIAFIIVIATLVFLKINSLNGYAAYTSSALFWSAVMLVLGTIKNYIRS
jgi:accessory gene regulator B